MDFISLGQNCTTRYQILLAQFKRQYPDAPKENFFRFLENLRDHHPDDLGNNFFDWRVTNFRSLIQCLKMKLENVFELDNLIIHPEKDIVQCSVCDVGYFHLFKFDRSIDLEPQLFSQFASIKPKVDYLAKKFIERISQKPPITFVRFGYASTQDWSEFFRLINSIAPINEHRVINFDYASLIPSQLLIDERVQYIKLDDKAADHIDDIFLFSEFLKDNLALVINAKNY